MSYDYGYAGAPPPANDPYHPAPYAQHYGQPAPYHHGPPAYAAPQSYGPPAAAAAPFDEVRTVFITGFPNDVKERELNNLLRFLPGYEASQMNWKNNQAQGFALFSSGHLARAACDAISQLVFDEASTLRTEMARKNMYIKDDPAAKRARPNPYPGGAPGGPGPYRTAAPYSGGGGPGGAASLADNPPCNTLFIGNLADNVDEAELSLLFSQDVGFRQVKVVRGKNTSAFVEFEDINTASGAHAAHQNVVLRSSDRGPIRVQFSKNPFGKKRDLTGHLIDTPARDMMAGDPNAGMGIMAPTNGGPH